MAKRLSHAQIEAALGDLPEWRIGDDGRLLLELEATAFAEALGFLNAVAYLAERHDHHPDLQLHDYKRVRVTLTSHDVGGVTDRDLRLASAICQLRLA